MNEIIQDLGALHYEICNGGWSQACYNGYIDDYIEKYDSFINFLNKIKESVSNKDIKIKTVIETATKLYLEAYKSTELIKLCDTCGGDGYSYYEEEDGERQEEECYDCHGAGTIDVDNYSQVDFYNFNSWNDAWDSKYYKEVDSDVIDILTCQSHNHSIMLDAIKGESINLKKSINLLKENGYSIKNLNENYYKFTSKQINIMKKAIVKMIKNGFQFSTDKTFITIDKIDYINDSNICDILVYDEFKGSSVKIISQGKFLGKYIEKYHKSKGLNDEYNCFIAFDKYIPEEAIQAANSWIEYKKFMYARKTLNTVYSKFTASRNIHDLD